jgi:hypothetical protein
LLQLLANDELALLSLGHADVPWLVEGLTVERSCVSFVDKCVACGLCAALGRPPDYVQTGIGSRPRC